MSSHTFALCTLTCREGKVNDATEVESMTRLKSEQPIEIFRNQQTLN